MKAFFVLMVVSVVVCVAFAVVLVPQDVESQPAAISDPTTVEASTDPAMPVISARLGVNTLSGEES